MNTPLYKAIQQIINSQHARFYMPGHKGIPTEPFGDILAWDITEIDGADNLYQPTGAIAELEARYTHLYGSTTLLSAGGSTLAIQTMLAYAVGHGGTVLIERGCHSAAIHTMALLHITPVWLYPSVSGNTGLQEPLTASQVQAMLQEHPNCRAVYLTSPDYYGQITNIPAIASVCKAHHKPLLVDAAHGAHLPFLPVSQNPILAGADYCCHSLHKTLPACTGAALLHAAAPITEDLKRIMALFGSTSPSYLIMLSADCLLEYLETSAMADIAERALWVGALREQARQLGIVLLPQQDPLRIVLAFGASGYTQAAFLSLLVSLSITTEYTDDYYAVFLFGTTQRKADFARFSALLQAMRQGPPRPLDSDPIPQPVQQIPLAEVIFLPATCIPVAKAEGKTAAHSIAPCPPGIPLVLPGERIDATVIAALKKHGISEIRVL